MSTFCLPGSTLEVKEEFKKCRKRPRIREDHWTKWAVQEACFVSWHLDLNQLSPRSQLSHFQRATWKIIPLRGRRRREKNVIFLSQQLISAMVSSFSLDEVVNLCASVLAGEFKVLQDLWKPYRPPWKQSKRSTARSWTCYCRRLVILASESLPKPGEKKKRGIQLCLSWPH